MTTQSLSSRELPLSLTFDAVLISFGGLATVFLYGLMPDSEVLLVPIYVLLSILSVRYVRFPIYYIVIILTLVKFFQVPDFTIYKSSIGQSFRFADANAAIIKYADEMALLLCLQALLIRTRLFTRASSFVRSLGIRKYLVAFVCIVFASALLNGVPFVNILYFSSNWLRPFVLFLYILSVPWSQKQVVRFFSFLIVLAFLFQWGGSIVVNWQRAVTGELFWIDDFTGTFMFPLCELAAFLLAIALFMFLSEFFVSKKMKHLLFAGLALFGILSAQVGTMTAMLLLILAVFFGAFLLSPRRFGLSGFKGRAAIVFSLVSITAVFVLLLVGTPASEGQAFTIGYARSQFNKWVVDVVSIADIPKILAYVKLAGAFLSGEINPLWGAGPAMYLTGIGSALSTSALVEKYSGEALLGGVLGQATSQSISIVGLLGELGVFGFLSYMALLLAIYRNLWKRRAEFYGSMWHGVFVGTIGSFAFLLAYATIQTAFDGWIHVLYNLCFCGGLLMVSRDLTKGNNA